MGAPQTPFPASVPAFSVRLPLPTIPPQGHDPVSEFSCAFAKENERAYQASPNPYQKEEEQIREWMYAVEYKATTPFGAIRGGLVVNARSGKVSEAVTQIVTALARVYAIWFAYLNQHPPLQPPANPGLLSPLSLEAMTMLDGTVHLRGFCSGIRSLNPDLVDSATVYVGEVFAVPAPLPPPS